MVVGGGVPEGRKEHLGKLKIENTTQREYMEQDGVSKQGDSLGCRGGIGQRGDGTVGFCPLVKCW